MSIPSERVFKSLMIDGAVYETTFTRKFEQRKPHAQKDPRELRAHIPAVVQEIHVAPGQEVRRGEPLLVIEAMKMKNELTATRAGRITSVHVRTGQMVCKDELLVEME